jgi:hypothetical protein
MTNESVNRFPTTDLQPPGEVKGKYDSFSGATTLPQLRPSSARPTGVKIRITQTSNAVRPSNLRTNEVSTPTF